MISLPHHLVKENEKITFDLQSRTLILIDGRDLVTHVVRLSPIDAHLLLPLVSFYPQYVPDSILSVGYTVDLLTYYQYLREEVETNKSAVIYPLEDGMERLKKRVASLGITVVRVRTIGYLLERCSDSHTQRNIQGRNMVQVCR